VTSGENNCRTIQNSTYYVTQTIYTSQVQISIYVAYVLIKQKEMVDYCRANRVDRAFPCMGFG